MTSTVGPLLARHGSSAARCTSLASDADRVYLMSGRDLRLTKEETHAAQFRNQSSLHGDCVLSTGRE